MKLILCFLFFALCFLNLSAQPHHTFGVRDDSEAAQRYVQWIMRAIDEGRITEVYAALKRASDFVDVSSDISYLQAIVNYKFLFAGETRLTIIDALNTAIETNRWVIFNENTALLLMAENLVAVREYSRALETIERIGISPAVIPADAAMQRLLALRGMAAGGDISALAQFRSGVLNAFDRFPRDPRPLRIFFEFARNRLPEPSVLPSGDINLMELALRRLPFLLEFDPELAWMAVPFIRNLDDARRLLSSYRAGGIQHIHIRDFFPHPASISLALNLGLIDDFTAADELFSGNRGFNNPLPSGISNTVFASNGNPVIQKNIITDVYDLLRSDEGREYFTRKLLEFTGAIIHDEDNDGYIESFWLFHEGVIRKFAYDNNQDSLFDMTILFDTDGIPVSASSRILGHEAFADIQWERYP
ncbi:MAG: hypothetical protein FWC97_02640, partial [Treponema sp.]|nr:hypothetical protein [Treponema sp.]